jgi:hypothetical protein
MMNGYSYILRCNQSPVSWHPAVYVDRIAGYGGGDDETLTITINRDAKPNTVFTGRKQSSIVIPQCVNIPINK